MDMLAPELLVQIFQEVKGIRPSGPYNRIIYFYSMPYDEYNDMDYDISLTPYEGCQKTLAVLCLVSRTFNAIATPILYQRLELSLADERGMGRRSSRLLNTLESRPSLGRHIIRLNINNASPEPTWFRGRGEKECDGERRCIRAAEKVESLLKIATGLEHLILERMTQCWHEESGGRPYSDHQEASSAAWSKAFLPLIDCPRFSSLWSCRNIGGVPFSLPLLPSLVDLQFDTCHPGATLSSSLPNLTTLSIQGAVDLVWPHRLSDAEKNGGYGNIDSNMEHLKALLPHLQNIYVAESITPFLAVTVLKLAPNLKFFRFRLKFSSSDENVPLELVSFRDTRRSLDTVNIRIFYEGPRCPSARFITDIRKLLFDISAPNNVKICFSLKVSRLHDDRSRSDDDEDDENDEEEEARIAKERADFVKCATEMWQAEGSVTELEFRKAL